MMAIIPVIILVFILLKYEENEFGLLQFFHWSILSILSFSRTSPISCNTSITNCCTSREYDSVCSLVCWAPTCLSWLLCNLLPSSSFDLRPLVTLHFKAFDFKQIYLCSLYSAIVSFNLFECEQAVNALNTEKNTPLHWACLNGHIEVMLYQ